MKGQESKTVTDPCGRTFEVPLSPKRIISLVPSQTELLFDLGLTDEVIGITKFCIHPKKWFQEKIRIGGTKNPKIALIKTLQPDLILANKEENRKEDIEALTAFCPVWVSDIQDLDNALSMIQDIGMLCNKLEKAKEISSDIQVQFQTLKPLVEKKKVAYFIWKNPWMSINQQTFIHDMLSRCGFENVFAKHIDRYPETSLEELKTLKPDYIFLSSEPFPFKEKHIDELQNTFDRAKIMLVDGEMFSWYGSRLLKSVDYFKSII
jgi:ABC-type Fe3+-hydroxamate transport system substrate-binding protein